MSESTIALFGLIGAAIGAIPGVLGVVIPWLRNRDKVAQAARDLELAKKEVEFISAWLEAASSIADEADLKALKGEARARLSSLMSASKESSDSLVSSRMAERQARPSRKGRLALFTYLGFFAFMLFGASIDDQNNVSLQHLISEVFSDDGGIVIAILAIPLIWLFWRWYRSNRAVA